MIKYTKHPKPIEGIDFFTDEKKEEEILEAAVEEEPAEGEVTADGADS